MISDNPPILFWAVAVIYLPSEKMDILGVSEHSEVAGRSDKCEATEQLAMGDN